MWVGRWSHKTKSQGRPPFCIENWNHFYAVLSETTELTNNKSEAYNSAMKLSIPHRPNMWAILAGIKGKDMISYTKVSASLAGH